MTTLVHQRCYHHDLREAAARCPECGHFYCRECITEHDDRVLCAGCLKKLSQPALGSKVRMTRVWPPFWMLAGVLVSWLFFQLVAQVLLEIPSSFHEGQFWTSSWWDSP